MSLHKFGRLCGVGQSYLSRLELCEIGKPSNEKLAKIAPFLGLSLEQLIQIGSEQDIKSNHRPIEDSLLELENLTVEQMTRLRDVFNEKLAAIEALERGIT